MSIGEDLRSGHTYREQGQRRLGVDIRRGAPKLLEDAVRAKQILGEISGGERWVGLWVVGNRLGVLSLAHKFGLDSFKLWTGIPRLDEIANGNSTGGGANDLQHPLRRVGTRRTGRRSLTLEVVDESARILADVAIVDSATTARKEQQTVKFLEEHAGGLVDGAENGLSVGSEFAEQLADRPGSLRVKTTTQG